MLQRTKAKQALKGKTLSPAAPEQLAVPVKAAPAPAAPAWGRHPRHTAALAGTVLRQKDVAFSPAAGCSIPSTARHRCPGSVTYRPARLPASFPPPRAHQHPAGSRGWRGDSQRPILRSSPRSLARCLQNSQKKHLHVLTRAASCILVPSLLLLLLLLDASRCFQRWEEVNALRRTPKVTSLGETPKYLVSAPTEAVNTFFPAVHAVVFQASSNEASGAAEPARTGQGWRLGVPPWASSRGCPVASGVSAARPAAAALWPWPWPGSTLLGARAALLQGRRVGFVRYRESRFCGTG